MPLNNATTAGKVSLCSTQDLGRLTRSIRPPSPQDWDAFRRVGVRSLLEQTWPVQATSDIGTCSPRLVDPPPAGRPLAVGASSEHNLQKESRATPQSRHDICTKAATTTDNTDTAENNISTVSGQGPDKTSTGVLTYYISPPILPVVSFLFFSSHTLQPSLGWRGSTALVAVEPLEDG